jgi:hypothetical protein
MHQQNNQRFKQDRRTIERAAAAHIGWNVGQEIWAWVFSIAKVLWLLFFIFCLVPLGLGIYLVTSSRPDYQVISPSAAMHVTPHDAGWWLILIAIVSAFLLYLLVWALWALGRWLARKL